MAAGSLKGGICGRRQERERERERERAESRKKHGPESTIRRRGRRRGTLRRDHRSVGSALLRPCTCTTPPSTSAGAAAPALVVRPSRTIFLLRILPLLPLLLRRPLHGIIVAPLLRRRRRRGNNTPSGTSRIGPKKLGVGIGSDTKIGTQEFFRRRDQDGREGRGGQHRGGPKSRRCGLGAGGGCDSWDRRRTGRDGGGGRHEGGRGGCGGRGDQRGRRGGGD
mmetsp:Transcript_30613/g.91539  ORF Transcript_30613/g.91539 Transcript_30613/m.91539 type:complete len:223 (+) Transcript_30613:767-1435(+)